MRILGKNVLGRWRSGRHYEKIGAGTIRQQGSPDGGGGKSPRHNPDPVVQYKKGKTNVLQFLLGKVMAETGGKANPKIVKEILEKLLVDKK